MIIGECSYGVKMTRKNWGKDNWVIFGLGCITECSGGIDKLAKMQALTLEGSEKDDWVRWVPIKNKITYILYQVAFYETGQVPFITNELYSSLEDFYADDKYQKNSSQEFIFPPTLVNRIKIVF